MGRKTVSAYVETEVDVDLNMFSQEDIIDFLEDQGYTVFEGKCETAVNDLDKRIWELYVLYTSDKGAGPKMDKALGSFFADYYNKVSV